MSIQRVLIIQFAKKAVKLYVALLCAQMFNLSIFICEDILQNANVTSELSVYIGVPLTSLQQNRSVT